MTTIKLLFTGLLDFHWKRPNRFEIGVLKEEPQHCLSIGIEKSVSGSPTYKVLTYHPSPPGGACAEVISGNEIHLNVTKTGRPAANPRPPDPIGSPPATPDDLRRCITMDGPGFHDSPARPLPHHRGCFSPIIHVDHGEFYKEATGTVIQERKSGGTAIRQVDIAWYIGADIILNAGEWAVLKYGSAGRYDFRHAPDTNYVVFIENGCYNAAEGESDYTDFDDYYECITIDDPDRYRLRKVGTRDRERDELLLKYPVITYTGNCVWGEDINKERQSRDNPCDPIYTRFGYW